MRRHRVDLKLALAVPGVVLALLGVVLARAWGVELRAVEPAVLVPATLVAYLAIGLVSVGFERMVPSFREASGALESAVRGLRLTAWWAVALGLTSAIGEEVFFRGFLLGLLDRPLGTLPAVIVQAIAFAALHPAPRRAWAYTAWTFAVGLLLGAVAAGSGSVLPGILAHYVFNHQNFNVVLADPSGSGRRT